MVELKYVLYAPNIGYNLFSPNAEYDGNSWDRLGGSDGVMTAFNGGVTPANWDGMLVTIACQLGERAP